jgi:hypothetical protein
MTYDEFLDNEKKRGHIIYICDKCDYRGYGAGINYHEMHHAGHTCISEDSILDLDLMSKPKPDYKKFIEKWTDKKDH